jgi:transcriptional regulator with XRE-family HTH domain
VHTDAVDAFYRAFGERVRQTREGRLSQAQLARQMRLSRGSIANIEAGRQRIPLHVLLVLARELGVEPEALIPRELAGPDDVVPPDRLRRLHALDIDDVQRVVRRGREEREAAAP